MAGGWELRGFRRIGTRLAWGMAAYVSLTQVSRLWRFKAEGLSLSATGSLGREGGEGEGRSGGAGQGDGSSSSSGSSSNSSSSSGSRSKDDAVLRSYAPIAGFNASLVRNEDSYAKIASNSFEGMRFKSFDHGLLSSAVASLRFASGRIADTLEHERPAYFRAAPNHSVELRAADLLRKLIVFPRVCFAKIDLLQDVGDGSGTSRSELRHTASGSDSAKVRTLLDAAAATALHVAQKCSYVPSIRDALLGRSGENTGLVMTAALPLLRFHSSSAPLPSSFYSSKFMATSVIVLNRALYLRGYGPGAAAAHSPAAAAALADSCALGEDGVKRLAAVIAARVHHVARGLADNDANAEGSGTGGGGSGGGKGDFKVRVTDARSGVEVAKVRLGARGGLDVDVSFQKGTSGGGSSAESSSGSNVGGSGGGAKSALLLEASELARLVHRLAEAEAAAAAALHGGAAAAAGAVSSSGSSCSSSGKATLVVTTTEQQAAAERALCLRSELSRLGVPAMLRSFSAAMFRVNAQVSYFFFFYFARLAVAPSRHAGVDDDGGLNTPTSTAGASWCWRRRLPHWHRRCAHGVPARRATRL